MYVCVCVCDLMAKSGNIEGGVIVVSIVCFKWTYMYKKKLFVSAYYV